MTERGRIRVAVQLAAYGLVLAGAAQTEAATEIRRSVLSNGGGIAISPQHTLQATLGQPVVGSSSGFWQGGSGVPTSWTEFTQQPLALRRHTAIYDPVRDRMVVFGGSNASLFNDTWVLPMSGSPAWTMLTPSGDLPSPREDHTAIYDPVRDRIVVFGGHDGISYLNDTWVLSLSGGMAWSELVPSGNPPPGRIDHTAVYDPVRDQMVVFGGNDGTSYRNDTWVLTLSGSPAWSELSPATPSGALPAARAWHASIYDSVRDGILMFGGYGAAPDLADTWYLTFGGGPAWTQLATAGPGPIRWGHTAVYDEAWDRLVVFGGYRDGVFFDDTWALKLSGAPAWIPFTAPGTGPSARSDHSAIYDPVRKRMVVFGGWTGPEVVGDTWAFDLGSPSPVSVVAEIPSRPSRQELEPNRPNPFNSSTLLAYSLPEEGRVLLKLYDVHGRLVTTLVDDVQPAGRHVATWNGHNAAGGIELSGIYFLRLECGRNVKTRKIVLAR